jgi:hypothetical protein
VEAVILSGVEGSRKVTELQCHGFLDFARNDGTVIVFWRIYALVSACHGSPKTQNVKNAIAHPESGKPLARLAAKQMPAMREQRTVARCLPILRVLPRPPSLDIGRQVTAGVRLYGLHRSCHVERSEASLISLLRSPEGKLIRDSSLGLE